MGFDDNLINFGHLERTFVTFYYMCTEAAGPIQGPRIVGLHIFRESVWK